MFSIKIESIIQKSYSLLLVICSMFLFNCANHESIIEKMHEEKDKGGVIFLYVDELPAARTILPQNTDWSSFTGTFEISITETNTSVTLPAIERSIHNLSAPIQLNAGNYNVAVTAYLNPGVPVAKGEIDITVTAGVPAAHILVMRAIIDSLSVGTFRWNITIPSVTSAQMTITHIAGAPAGSVVTLAQGLNSSSRDLNSGYYFVTTTLKRTNHADIVRRDVLHIYQNMTSVFTVEFPDAMFNNNLHNIIFDHTHDGLSATQPVIHGEKAVRPSVPIRPGHIFMNWYTDSSLTTLYDFDTLVSIDVTLYARWGTVTVTSGGVTTPYTNLTAALDSITAA